MLWLAMDALANHKRVRLLTITAGILFCVIPCETFSVSGNMKLRVARDALGILAKGSNGAPFSGCIRLRMEQGNHERGWLHHFVSHAFYHQRGHVRHQFFHMNTESESMPSNSTLEAESCDQVHFKIQFVYWNWICDQGKEMPTTLSASKYYNNIGLYASPLTLAEEQIQAKIGSLEDQWQQDECDEMVEDIRNKTRLRDFLEILYTQS